MGHVIRGAPNQAHHGGRSNRLGWLLLGSAASLALWCGVIVLIVRALNP
jgi:hypothetical protein